MIPVRVAMAAHIGMEHHAALPPAMDVAPAQVLRDSVRADPGDEHIAEAGSPGTPARIDHRGPDDDRRPDHDRRAHDDRRTCHGRAHNRRAGDGRIDGRWPDGRVMARGRTIMRRARGSRRTRPGGTLHVRAIILGQHQRCSGCGEWPVAGRHCCRRHADSKDDSRSGHDGSGPVRSSHGMSCLRDHGDLPQPLLQPHAA
jgi:hypothetical protein